MSFIETPTFKNINKYIRKSIRREGNHSSKLVQMNDRVRIHLTAWVAKSKSEKPFYNTIHHEPLTVHLDDKLIMKGLKEAICSMRVGEVASFLIASDYAFGQRGFPAWGIPPLASLQYDIHLLNSMTAE